MIFMPRLKALRMRSDGTYRVGYWSFVAALVKRHTSGWETKSP